MTQKLKDAIEKRELSENSFEAGVSGNSGTLSYGTTYGTPQGGNIVQNPDHFSSSEKTITHFTPNTSKGAGAVQKSSLPKRPDVKSDQVSAGPTTPAKDDVNLKPLDPEKEFDPQVDQIFKAKKNTPSPDEVMSALQYELNNMVSKDKHVAKQTVLNNLKQDPQYYSRLNMLNIDDKKMKVDETTIDKTKAVLDEMIASKQKNRPVATNPEINAIFKDMTDKRFRRG